MAVHQNQKLKDILKIEKEIRVTVAVAVAVAAHQKRMSHYLVVAKVGVLNVRAPKIQENSRKLKKIPILPYKIWTLTGEIRFQYHLPSTL